MSGPRSLHSTLSLLLVPIPRPLDLVADDVVDSIGRDEEDPVCVLCSRGYLKGLVLSQLVRDLRESLLRFIQAFIDSIQHTSEGGGLIHARSSTGSLGAASSGALHRFWLVRLLARINQPYHHTVGHGIPPCIARRPSISLTGINPRTDSDENLAAIRIHYARGDDQRLSSPLPGLWGYDSFLVLGLVSVSIARQAQTTPTTRTKRRTGRSLL